ncbi:MAG: ribosome hibernation-promoting factor, HPF/YfiA family [Pyrinomonadaceae bacterium]
MKITFTGRHLVLTPTIKNHVKDHFGKIEHLFTDGAARAHIVIEVEKGRHIGEAIVNWRDHTLTARVTDRDMYNALTQAIAKIETQAVKLKKKIIERKQHAKPLSAITALGETRAALNNQNKPIAGGTPQKPRIISQRRYQIKPMTVDEAILSLVDLHEQFIVYRDAETNQTSVLYKRRDGNFGLIES